MSEENVSNVQSNAQPTQAPVQTNEQKPNVPVTPDSSKEVSGEKSVEQKATEKAIRKMKLKVDGIEEELSEEEVVALAQQSKAAQKRFAEAAKMRKDSARFLEMLKENPEAVLSHPDIGIDIKAFAEQYLIKELEKSEMSPEAKKAYELEQKLAKIEKEKEEEAKSKETEKQQRLQQEWSQKYEQDFQAALQEVEIPKTPQSVQRMAIYMAAALENDVDLSPKQAAQMVKNDYLGDIIGLLKQAPGEVLLSLLGEDIATKIRKTDLARLEAKLTEKPTPTPSQTQEGVREAMPRTTDKDLEGRKMLSTLEWRERMDQLRKS